MKYLKIVKTDADLIDPKLSTPSVYVSLATGKVDYFGKYVKAGQPDNEIWYTTEDGLKFSIGGEEIGMQGYIDLMCNPDPEQGYGCVYKGPTIVEEVFEDGVWKIKFDAPVTHVGAEEDYFDNPKTGINIYPLFDGYEVGTNMTWISLPKTVTNVDKTTFRSCIYVTDFELPANVTHIGDYAFSICGWFEEGTNITLPSSVTYLGKALFTESNIGNLTYKGTKAQFIAIEKHADWNYSGSSTDPIAIKVVHCSDGDLDLTGESITVNPNPNLNTDEPNYDTFDELFKD